MLVPPSEWPLKTSALCTSTYEHPYTTKRYRMLWTKFHAIFIRRRRIFVDVETTIGVAIFTSDVECQCTEWRRGVSNFPDMRHKSVTIATSLEQAVAISIKYYKAHNVLNICWKFGRHQSRNSGVNNERKRAYFYPPTQTEQMRHTISEVTGPKFTKFSSDAEKSSALRSSQQLSNTGGDNEDGVCVNFRQYAPQIGYHSNVPWASHHNVNILLYSSLIALHLLKVW